MDATMVKVLLTQLGMIDLEMVRSEEGRSPPISGIGAGSMSDL